MKKNNRSINNINQDLEPVNIDTDIVQVCPSVFNEKGQPLNGSKKRKAMESIRPYVESVHELMGFEYACKHFVTKPGTMLEFLNRSGKKTRKVITPEEINHNQIYLLHKKTAATDGKLDRAVVDLRQVIEHGNRQSDINVRFHEIQSHLHALMADHIRATQANFTEHILRNDSNEVSPTTDNLALNDIKQLKAGPTSSVEVDRLSVSNKRKAGKVTTFRPRKTRGTPRDRYEQSKWRHRRV